MAVVGIGVDLVEVARIAAALTRTPSLASRLFTAAEREDCGADGPRPRWERLAARFAAKEAFAKALGTGVRGFAFRDVEVANDELGRPLLRLGGRAAAVADAHGVTVAHVSLATTREHGLAQVVLEGDETFEVW